MSEEKKIDKESLIQQIMNAEINIQRNDAVKKFCQWMLDTYFNGKSQEKKEGEK